MSGRPRKIAKTVGNWKEQAVRPTSIVQYAGIVDTELEANMLVMSNPYQQLMSADLSTFLIPGTGLTVTTTAFGAVSLSVLTSTLPMGTAHRVVGTDALGCLTITDLDLSVAGQITIPRKTIVQGTVEPYHISCASTIAVNLLDANDVHSIAGTWTSTLSANRLNATSTTIGVFSTGDIQSQLSLTSWQGVYGQFGQFSNAVTANDVTASTINASTVNVGQISIENTNEINSVAGTIYLQYDNANNVYLCNGGGAVTCERGLTASTVNATTVHASNYYAPGYSLGGSTTQPVLSVNGTYPTVCYKSDGTVVAGTQLYGGVFNTYTRGHDYALAVNISTTWKGGFVGVNTNDPITELDVNGELNVRDYTTLGASAAIVNSLVVSATPSTTTTYPVFGVKENTTAQSLGMRYGMGSLPGFSTTYYPVIYSTYAGLYFSVGGVYVGYMLDYMSGDGHIDFTAQHRASLSDSTTLTAETAPDFEGCVLVSTGVLSTLLEGVVYSGKDAITTNESIPLVALSAQAYDSRVFGVLSLSPETTEGEDSEGGWRSYATGALRTIIRRPVNDLRVLVNSGGEGAIWVCDQNGPVANGDYLTTSDQVGLAMQQSDDVLHNYTVAKATMSCGFILDSDDYICVETTAGKKAFIACTYHCG